MKATAPSGEDRRRSLVRAAYEVIAAEGFEGLRTRSVADRAGVNIATLHYYFPAKEDLIAGVAEYLGQQFAMVHAAPVPDAHPASARLAQVLADALLYRTERPDLVIVMQELMLRGRRDPTVQRLIDPVLTQWRTGIEKLIALGISEDVFKPGIAPDETADFMVSALTGALFLNLAPATLRVICDELESRLTA